MAIMIDGTAIGGDESIFYENDEAVSTVRKCLQRELDKVLYLYDQSEDWWWYCEVPDHNDYFGTTHWDLNIWQDETEDGWITKACAYPLEKLENGDFEGQYSTWITLKYKELRL